MLRDYSDKITSLKSNSVKVTLTVGKTGSGKLKKYASAPGYILLKRPDSILLNIQYPVTKTTILELLSVGDQFAVWNPSENKFYVGRNSIKEFELEGDGDMPSFSARPVHIFQAILPESTSLDQPDRRVMLTEEQDADAAYYVLTFAQETGGSELRALRRLWIERSQMVVAKEEAYTETGQVASVVDYSDRGEFDHILLPKLIHIERPLDGYKLDLKFGSWNVNPDLPDSDFTLKPPERAERIVLKEKGRSGN